MNAIEDGLKGSYKWNLFTKELCNRQILCGVDADSAGTWEFLRTNASYVLSGVVLTGNHLYYNQSVGPWPLPNMRRDDRSISQLPFTAAQSNTGT